MSKSYLPIRSDWLARTLLTYGANGPDALMYSTLLGAPGAIDACLLIMNLPPDPSQEEDATQLRARKQLDRFFIRGALNWGRRVSGRDMDRFHEVSTVWRHRLDVFRDRDLEQVKDIMTSGGKLWVITPTNSYWPEQLRDLAERTDWAPPLCLWGRGNPSSLITCPYPLAVVGSRTCDQYGRYVAHEIGYMAASQGHLVISGGAMGADAQAHWGALSSMREGGGSGGGSTVAVFAGGMNHMGPLRNQEMFLTIERAGGALISELSPDTIPEGYRFLLRNRIIAALSSTIVVTQARHRSGALNTANWGTELGRHVYATPGRIDMPENTGCNRLIHEGKATILISVADFSEFCSSPHLHGNQDNVPQALI